jgi:AraC-like DNA-binding protein
LAHCYDGRDEDPTTHGDFVIPAGVMMPLVVDVRAASARAPARVYGPNASHPIVHGECPSTYIELCLDPLGAYTLFGPVVADIGESIVGLEDLVGTDAERLAERIQSAPTWALRARMLDMFLLERGARGPEPSSEVTAAWNLLVRSGGTSRIGEIAREVGWSHKHLVTKFKQQVGVAPRMAARLLRLSRVWRLVESGHDWARIAAESGYADQSHLVREFRKFTGTTPTALIGG